MRTLTIIVSFVALMLCSLIAEPLDLWRRVVGIDAVVVAFLCQYELGFQRGIAKGRAERSR